MNRTARLLVIVLCCMGSALLPLQAQNAGGQQSDSGTSRMSMSDMTGHMHTMMSHMQTMMPMMQGNQMMQHMMDNMKMMGNDLNQMMDHTQSMMADKATMQDKTRMQHLQDMLGFTRKCGDKLREIECKSDSCTEVLVIHNLGAIHGVEGDWQNDSRGQRQ